MSTIVERGPVWQISQRFGLIERSTEDAERLAEHRRVNARAERERAGLLAAATVGTDNKVYLCRKARARRAAEVLGLHHEGLSSRKIEAKTGVPRRTVRRILKAEGRRHD
ncbi:hypothetical protein [Nocardia sp. NBC_00511]|uniref:hypothetical protein n=1 Tax=Nocardia sp. NBC_00511 TaxID=2903591 RepID=UPI0030E58EE9